MKKLIERLEAFDNKHFTRAAKLANKHFDDNQEWDTDEHWGRYEEIVDMLGELRRIKDKFKKQLPKD